jgi:hypothetical protein
MGDPVKADAVAKEQNWTAMPHGPIHTDGLKSISTWRASRGDDNFVITIASGTRRGCRKQP